MKNYWEEKKAHGLGELELLIYRSNILGEDPSVTNWAGGNTSAKISEKDFRGRAVRVLRVKGSGTDLRTITRQGFPGVGARAGARTSITIGDVATKRWWTIWPTVLSI